MVRVAFSVTWAKVFASLIFFRALACFFRSRDSDDDGDKKSKKDDEDGDT